MIFRIVRDRVKSSEPKVISFRSYKVINGENFKQDLSLAPWHVGEVFKDVDDQLFFWNTLRKTIVDEHEPIKTMGVRGQDVPYMQRNGKMPYERNRKRRQVSDKTKLLRIGRTNRP